MHVTQKNNTNHVLHINISFVSLRLLFARLMDYSLSKLTHLVEPDLTLFLCYTPLREVPLRTDHKVTDLSCGEGRLGA